MLNLPLDTPGGGRVALREVANVEIVPSPNVIHHEGASRSIDVLAACRVVTSAPSPATSRTGSTRSTSRSATTRSCSASTRSARTRSSGCSSTASPRRSGSSSCCRRRSAAGGSRSCRSSRCRWRSSAACSPSWIGGGILSLGSLVGFFTVFGIAARNGILMINHFQHLERFEGETFGPELVMRGALERLSPILMTTLATGLALVPLVVAGNSPGHEIEHPLAVVIVGGLVTSTLLNLFVVPSLYLRFGRRTALGDQRRTSPCRWTRLMSWTALSLAVAVGCCGSPPVQVGAAATGDRAPAEGRERRDLQPGQLRSLGHGRQQVAPAEAGDAVRLHGHIQRRSKSV